MPSLTALEIDCLKSIMKNYGKFIEASALRHTHRPEVLAGIMMRESAGGRTLYPPGPAGLGDGKYGHGLMQIDCRWFMVFCRSEDWKDPAKNINMGAVILQRKRIYLATTAMQKGIGFLQNELEAWSIAAYNCGEGNAFKAMRQGHPYDYYTTHHDYVAAVLQYAEIYKSLTPEVNENVTA